MAERTKGWKSFWSGRFRRRYSRKASRVSRAEKAIGVVILVLLAAIAAAVYVKGRRYNPALYALSEKSAAEIQGVARDLSRAGPYVPVGAGAAESPTANASPAPTGAKTEEVKAKAEGAPVLPLNLKLEGWAPRGKPEQFTADTLYEKIDGRADVYQKFDVQRLDFVSFANAANPDQFVDLYVYDMGEPRNAFGIYAAERTPGAPAVALGREGYEAGGSLYFWKGPYYNLILPSSPSDSSPAAAAERVAQAADALEADDLSPLPFADLLPADGRVADSLAYLKKDALSQSFLDEVVSAQYALGTGAPLLAFVRECKSAEEAASLLKQYQEYLDKYARPAEVKAPDGADAADSGDFGGAVDVVFTRGAFFAGVSQAADAARAGQLADRVSTHLAEVVERRAAAQGFAFDKGDLVPSSVEGGEWKAAGAVERFHPDNLYEKIDGAAEQFLSFGFRALQCVSFADAQAPDDSVDVYVYDHGSPLNALGIYAAQRPADASLVDVGREGYEAEGSLFFWKGRAYVQIVAANPTPAAKQFVQRLAWTIAPRIADAMGPLPGFSLLPDQGRVRGSEQFILTNALSQSFLDHVCAAQYDLGEGKRLRAFVTMRSTPAEAEALLGRYRAFQQKYEQPADLGAALPEVKASAGDMAGAFEIVFAEGPVFAGVLEAPSLDAAAAFAKTFAERLKALTESNVETVAE